MLPEPGAEDIDSLERRDMGAVIFIVLTLAIFGLLGLVQKLVERL